ncbi:MAG: LPP20 family lipoprotein [Fusobacteriaceae bacterium]
MKKYLKLFFAFLLIFSVAKSAEEIPDWFMNPQKQYPKGLYIVGTGSGYNLESAMNVAYTQISQQFEVKINANQELNQSYNSSGGATTSDNLSMNTNTSVTSSLNMKGIEKGPTANVGGKFYALAYIDKMKAAEMYKSSIANNMKIIKTLISNAEKATEPVVKYAGYNSAYNKHRENLILLDQCSIVSPNDEKDIRANLEKDKQLLSQLPISRENSALNIKFSINSSSPEVSAILTNVISNSNYKIVDSGASAFVATGNIKYTEMKGPDGTVAYQVATELSIKNSAGTVVASSIKSTKVVGVDFNAVKTLSGKKVIVPATEELATKFQAYISSLVQ